jgi:hypothetical protein
VFVQLRRKPVDVFAIVKDGTCFGYPATKSLDSDLFSLPDSFKGL